MKITVLGKPIAKKRPRFARVGKFVRTYNDQETEESRWLWEAIPQLPDAPMDGPVKMRCEFIFPRPKGHFGTGRNAGNLKPSAPVFHVQKPDTDNCLKFVKDCLNAHAYFDDCQVFSVVAQKRWAEPGERARTEIWLDTCPK